MSLLTSIGFFSPLVGVGVDCGYGYAAVELITAWQRQLCPVWAFDREAPVIFNMGQPHFYEHVEGKLNIGYTPWESTKVPDSWLGPMKKMDEIWVPCQANKEWYEDAGLENVKILPHGINSQHYPLKKRELPEDGVLRFLHIGEPTKRKGGLMAVNAFKKAFGNREDVHLTLKGNSKMNLDAQPNITVVRERIPLEQMRELYHSHHALVYPTMGEGFGFIPFQGAATGMPTFVTNWSGPEDYMHYCWPIDVAAMVEADYAPHEGMWAQPSERSLRYWMESFVAHPQEYFDIAADKAKLLHDDWQWDDIAVSALEMMSESLNSMV